MKAYLADLVRAAPTPAHGRNVAREYLQARILGAMQRVGAMIPLAFHGGTALRFLHAIPRYSEDLDFALERAREQYDFRAYLVRFVGLPYELGLSPHRDEVLAVKIEVDTNPPAGAALATTVIRRHVILQLQHHDRASMLAGKLHALMQRPYTKGRDLYDLLWYLSDPDWPGPNLALLKNALRQTGWAGSEMTEESWRPVLADHLQRLNWDRVVDDVRPLLDTGADLDLLTPENMLQVVSRRR